ncbi:hypothetical protein LCGC14_2537730 [marine sediment metagenome]|uniref:Uncharacterized protein n=1 Tax=marine sediment metagenome TaxID=412755 RepID=A0A0F9AS57_9ZZZZ
MYVKITAGSHGGDLIFETAGPIESGALAAEVDNDGEVAYTEAIPSMPALLHMLEIDLEQRTKYERTSGLVRIRWARWPDQEEGSVGLVTTRNVFIVGDDGKTIDRVR